MRKFISTLLLLTPLAVSCRFQSRDQSQLELQRPRAMQNFVKVSQGKFQLNSEPFYFVGSNFYRLALSDAFNGNVIKENKAGVIQYPQIDRVMQNYAADGFKVIRLWGFSCEGSKGSNSYPPLINKDLSLNADGMQQLDYTIASAGQHGIRIILPLVNFEHEYCGMEWWVDQTLAKQTDPSQKYLTWSCIETRSHHALKLVHDPRDCQALNRPENPVEAVVTKEFFYFDSTVKNAFKAHVVNYLSRVNPYTGLSYKDDPAIMAVELTNEAHTTDYYECLSTAVGSKTYSSCSQEDPSRYKAGELVHTWLREMSGFLKSVDSNHLITTGEEGYRSSHQDPDCLNKNSWINNGMKGVDFARNVTLPDVDFMTTHLYPDNWNIPTTDLDWFDRCIIRDRANLAAQQGKPIIIEETGFSELGYDGKPDDYRRDRAHYISRMYRYANQAGFQGTMIWQAAPLTLGDKVSEDDSFTFPIKQKIGEQFVYSPEGMTMIKQIDCQKSMAQGGKAEDCVYICPRGTSVNADRLGRDPQGFSCYLPVYNESSGLDGYPACTADANPSGGWGWIKDGAICGRYTIGSDQYAQQGGCSCKI